MLNGFSPISQAFAQKSWTWNEVASGHVMGNKAGRAFAKNSYPIDNTLRWVANVFDSHSLYRRVQALGLFNKHPALIRPIQAVIVGVATINLCTYLFPGTTFSLELLWHLTPKIHAVGAIFVAVFEFHKHPMKTVAFFTAGAITLINRSSDLLPKKISWLWKQAVWPSYVNLFWNGDMSDRLSIIIKLSARLLPYVTGSSA
ncbi:MAG: hypothetical protein ACRDFB_06525 [Rhabdochlamydiaceae bacterium]